jgi:hypothetical protein
VGEPLAEPKALAEKYPSIGVLTPSTLAGIRCVNLFHLPPSPSLGAWPDSSTQA